MTRLSDAEHERRQRVLADADTIREAADRLGLPYSTTHDHSRRHYDRHEEEFGIHTGRRDPCEICGASRNRDVPPNRLRTRIEGEQVLVCPECEDEHRGPPPEMAGGRAPEFRVPEDSPLADRFRELETQTEQKVV